MLPVCRPDNGFHGCRANVNSEQAYPSQAKQQHDKLLYFHTMVQARNPVTEWVWAAHVAASIVAASVSHALQLALLDAALRRNFMDLTTSQHA